MAKGSIGGEADGPVNTVTSHGKDGLMAASMVQANGDRVGRSADEPVTTLTGRSTQQQVMGVAIDKYYATGVAADAEEPLDTVTRRDRFGLVGVFMEQANTGLVGHEMTAPISTIVGKGCTQRLIEVGMIPANQNEAPNRALVIDFLWEQFGEPTEDEWANPTATEDGRLKFGLVMLDGAVWHIVDIGMRMLTPRELFNAQGFPPDYIIDRTWDGKPVTKTAQTSMAGNSVSPPPATAWLRANLPDHMLLKEAA
ncbi:MAG: DNA cytosine methyltransferase, partial [Alphaproteobacteria bacterium]|nr:DNA cytosine methyltransferase [Alphaproteobacteria bacterium]